jgi:hypothetical protein
MGILDIEFKWDNRELLLKELPHKDVVRFALFCAKQVVSQNQIPVAENAIKVVELWLEDRATREECGRAAYAAARAADAAYAAAYAAAARATYAADADAAAAYAGAYAAAAAAAAAGATNKETLKQEQMDYLRELIIKNLPEEDRDCWLLIVASL